MKKVLFISYHFPPSLSVGGFRVFRFVKYLSRNGWGPYVLTIKIKKNLESLLDFDRLKSLPKEVKIIRTRIFFFNERYKKILKFIKDVISPFMKKRRVEEKTKFGDALFTPKRKGFKSLLEELLRTPDIDIGWFPFALFWGVFSIYKNKIDVIYATGGPFSTTIIAFFLKKITHKPLVVDFRDPWSSSYLRDFSYPVLGKLAYYLEGMVLKGSDKIIANNEALKIELLSIHKDINAKKILVITNGFDEEEFEMIEKKHFNKFTIVYTGSSYEAHSPTAFFKGLKAFVRELDEIEENIQVLYVGPINEKYKEIIISEKLGNIVSFLGQRPHREALEILLSSHILVIFLTVPEGTNVIPAKIFEYLRAGKPILAITYKGVFYNFLKTIKAKIIVLEPQDINGIKKALYNLYEEYLRNKLNDSSIELIKEYDFKFLTKKLTKALGEVIK